MAFPTTGVLDSFTGTNGTDLPVYSSNWSSAPTGGVTLEIQDNAVTGTSAGSNNTNSWATTFGPDIEAYVTITTKPADGNIVLLLARGTQETSLLTADGYCLRFAPVAGTDTLTIQRIDNGGQTSISSAFSQEVSNGDSIGLEIVGSTLTAYYKPSGGNWTALGTATDSTYTTSGKIGLFTTSTTIRMDNFGGGTHIPTQVLTPGLFTNNQTFYSPTVTQSGGSQTLTPALFTNTQTFYSPTVVVVGTVTLLPSLFTNSQVFYSPTVSQGGVTLLPGLLTNTSVFYNPTVTTGVVVLQPSLFTNTQTFYSATINRGLVTLSPSLVTNNQTFFSPSVTTRNTLLPSLFTNSNTFYNPTVTSNKVLQPPLLTNTSIFYSAVVSQPGVDQTLLPSLVVNTQTFFSPLVFDSSFNFRITEDGDTRITEESDTRILEGDSSTATLEGIGSITADLRITKAARANLEGKGNLEASAEVLPFESTLYIKVNGVWKTATPYVKIDNIWRIPSYVGKKINGAWRRIY